MKKVLPELSEGKMGCQLRGKKVVDIFLIRYYIIHINKLGKRKNKRKTEEHFIGRCNKMKRENIFFWKCKYIRTCPWNNSKISDRDSLNRKTGRMYFE